MCNSQLHIICYFCNKIISKIFVIYYKLRIATNYKIEIETLIIILKCKHINKKHKIIFKTLKIRQTVDTTAKDGKK